MKKIRQLLFASLFLLPMLMSAQDMIMGNVQDEQGTALPGVSVMIQGTSTGTATDFDGNFELEVGDANAILVFSYLGYHEKEITASANMQVVLDESSESLNEVILIGYGQTTKKDATGAVEKVGVEEFNTGAIMSAEQLITGKTAGVNVVPPSGRPGEGGTIKIRGGLSSITNNSPLIVIDGVPVDQQDGPALNSINPDDIESFNILKDASSTAIYGSRATNGVILITTKSGKMNRDFRVGFNSYISVGEATNTVDVLSRDQFIDAINNLPDNENQVGLIGDADTNWQDEIYQTAFGTDNNLTVEEGWDKTSYRFALGYTYQEGVLKTSQFDRKNISLNVRHNAFKGKLKMDFNIRGSFINDDFADGGAIGSAVSFDPTKPIYSGVPQYGGFWEWIDSNSPGGNAPFTLAGKNPVGLLEQNTNSAATERYIGNAKFDYAFGFLDGLNIIANFGFDYSEVSGATKVPSTSASGFFNGGSQGTYGSMKRNTLSDIYLHYNQVFGKHKVEGMLGQSYQDFYRENESFGVDANGAESNVFTASTNSLLSYMARVNYTFNSKYLFTATFRRDGSSRFSSDNRWGNFYSGALAWNMAEEDFLNDSKTISTLKLRVGFGTTGQQEINNDFAYLPTYTPGGDNVRYQFGDRFVYTVRPEEYDENIKWEESVTYNIGLDYGLLDDRIWGSIEYFTRESSDILNNIPIPAGSNLSNTLITNIGDIDSKGAEFSINWGVIENENFIWDIGFNATWLDNEITKLNNVDDPTSPGLAVGGISGGVGNNVQTHKVGHEQFSYLVFEQVYDTSGNPLEGVYVDQLTVDTNNDGVVDATDGVINDQDKVIFKSPNPDFLLGFSSYMKLKNWDLNFVLRASIGNYGYNNVGSSQGDATRIRPNNDVIGNVHASYLDTNFQNAQFWSSYWVQDASFLKMDNITLGYNFTSIKEGDVKLRLYSSVTNVFTITDYTGLDPEINGGIDNNFYPRARTILVGLNLNF